MKIVKLMLPLLSLLLLACVENDNDTKDNTIVQSVPLVFSSYDLSTYFVPNVNLNHVYLLQVSEKTDNNPYHYSESRYNGDKYQRTDNNETNKTSVQIFRETALHKQYIIHENTISLSNFETNESLSYKRYVGLEDTIIEVRSEDIVDAITIYRRYSCKLLAHLPEKVVEETHTDVISLSCVIDESGNGTVSDLNVTISRTSKEDIHFAKNIGLIESIKEDCKVVTIGTSPTTKTCTKTEINLTYTTY